MDELQSSSSRSSSTDGFRAGLVASRRLSNFTAAGARRFRRAQRGV